jgi:hypothetical protein
MTLATIQSVAIKRDKQRSWAISSGHTGTLAITCLTALAILIHGYHPFAEDAGVYLPGIEKILQPELFPFHGHFVVEQSRFSLFAPAVAALVRISGVSLMMVMFLLYVACVWTTLFAAWKLASRCWSSLDAQLGAIALLALCLSMPVAGTSLMLFDPYVTGRTVSTPLCILALAYGVDMIRSPQIARPVLFGAKWPRHLALCAIAIASAALIHPLMAAYALGCILILACLSSSSVRTRMLSLLAILLIVGIASVLIYCLSSLPSISYIEAARTRTYWFLSTWHWYEALGLCAPLIILSAASLDRSKWKLNSANAIAKMAVIAGVLGLLVEGVFVHESSRTYAVARLQPLRIFQMIYIVLILTIGAYIGRFVLKQSIWRWAAMIVALGVGMFAVQRETFPHSSHIEFPWIGQKNDWTQGFLWIRANTSENAIFAMDADYISFPGEDAQGFRAISERSGLPDYSKDGGVAAISPDLADDWVVGARSQDHLNRLTDSQRIARLKSLGVEWIILPNGANTSFLCAYANESMKVCRLPKS